MDSFPDNFSKSGFTSASTRAKQNSAVLREYRQDILEKYNAAMETNADYITVYIKGSTNIDEIVSEIRMCGFDVLGESKNVYSENSYRIQEYQSFDSSNIKGYDSYANAEIMILLKRLSIPYQTKTYEKTGWS